MALEKVAGCGVTRGCGSCGSSVVAASASAKVSLRLALLCCDGSTLALDCLLPWVGRNVGG